LKAWLILTIDSSANLVKIIGRFSPFRRTGRVPASLVLAAGLLLAQCATDLTVTNTMTNSKSAYLIPWPPHR